MSTRIEYIDFLKAFGIFTVIYGHVYTENNWLYQFIYSFHMPLFFLLSGIFFKANKSINNLYIKRTRTLILPYLFFYIATYLYWIFVERNIRTNAGGVDADWWKPILGLIYESPYWNLFAHNNPLWFVPALLSVETFAYLTSKYDSKSKFYLGIAGIFLSILFAKLHLYLPFGIIMALYCYLFHYLGQKIHILNRLSYKQNLLSFIILLIFYCIYIYKFGYVPSTIFAPQIETAIAFYLIATYTITLLLLLAKLIRPILKISFIYKITFFLGSNTLIILCIHDPLKRVIIYLYSKITQFTIYDIRHDMIDSFFCSIIILLCLIPIIYFYNKYIKSYLYKIADYAFSPH